MKILLVDDEPKALQELKRMVGEALPGVSLNAFRRATEAMDFARENKIDIAFLDINMRIMDGITMARVLQGLNPQVNIIFCTGYQEYMPDAFQLYCSGYLLKPIQIQEVRKALAHLRYPVQPDKPIRIVCFGNFGAFYNGEPVRFKRRRTLEMLAYLVDRKGVLCSLREIGSVLFEEDSGHKEYLYKLRGDLLSTFEQLGQGEVILHPAGMLGLNHSLISCDYFEYLSGSKDLFRGEYMNQYSFAEGTLSALAAAQPESDS